MRAEGNGKVLQMIRVLMLLRCLVHVLLHGSVQLLQGSVQLLHDTHTFITSQPPCSCSSSRIYSDHLYISVRSIQMISSHSAAAEPEPMKSSLGSGSKAAAALFLLHQHDVWREEAGSLQRHQVLINIT
ncbi:hypothetical protein ILYODFUR_038353 [Ilyodon furcidens]|uniref:Secreted protein n=1 Tax=Ilyodon furcidens TaxID=33524 RepID=A0ABV0V9K4_9TELE